MTTADRYPKVAHDHLGQVESVRLKLRCTLTDLESSPASIDCFAKYRHRLIQERTSGLASIDVTERAETPTCQHQGRVLGPNLTGLMIKLSQRGGGRHRIDRRGEQVGDHLRGQLLAHRGSRLIIGVIVEPAPRHHVP